VIELDDEIITGNNGEKTKMLVTCQTLLHKGLLSKLASLSQTKLTS
jgi:hypothetical protein